jgi:uncharacterized phiE125 gp8 family phage protein
MIAAPSAEPVTLDEIKAHLDIDGAAEDTLLTTLIVVARAAIERMTGQLMLTQSWRISVDAVPPSGLMALPIGPVQTVSAVRVFDVADNAILWPGSGYTLDLVGEPARLLFHGGRPIPGRRLAGIEIDVVCGFGASAAAVPADLVQAVRLLVAHWYAARGNAVNASAVPDDVLALAGAHRRLRLSA